MGLWHKEKRNIMLILKQKFKVMYSLGRSIEKERTKFYSINLHDRDTIKTPHRKRHF